MINRCGYRIESPHLSIGNFSKYIERVSGFDTVVLIDSELLISDKGHQVLTENDWKVFRPLSKKQIGNVEITFWSRGVFERLGEYLKGYDSAFAVFINRSTGHTDCVYSMWDDSVTELYFDTKFDVEEILFAYNLKRTQFPGIFKDYNKFSSDEVLTLIDRIIEDARIIQE